MSLGAFARMSSDILNAIGEGSTLRANVPCKVNIEHGVQLTGALPRSGVNYVAHDDDFITERSVATIPKSLAPKAGDALTHPDGAYILDALLSDNGYNQRFILRVK